MASLFAKMAAQAKEAAATAAKDAAAQAKEAAASAAKDAVAGAKGAATSAAKDAVAGAKGAATSEAKDAVAGAKEQVSNNIQNIGADPNVNPFAKNNPAPPPSETKPEVPKEPVTNRHPEHKTIDPEVFTKLDCPTTPNTRSTVFVGNDKPDGARYEPYSEHYSGECTYINPDRDYATARALSIFGGLLALDHFYLRSPTTAFMKIIVNMLTFGLWWFWDVDQFVNQKERVLHYGLNYVFDLNRGIARGTILEGKPKFVSKKDFSSFILLGIFFGILGLDRMYLGDKFVLQGVIKFLSCFLLVGFIWVIWDMLHLLFLPDTILKEGYYPIPLPFSVYSEWSGVDAGLIGDIFQVTLTPNERSALAKEKADKAPSMLQSLATTAISATPAGAALKELQKKMPLPLPLGKGGSAKSLLAELPVQRGGSQPTTGQRGGAEKGETEGRGGLAGAAFATVMLLAGVTVGYSSLTTRT
jgi:TM2 domain-containing membrane protein YozV